MNTITVRSKTYEFNVLKGTIIGTQDHSGVYSTWDPGKEGYEINSYVTQVIFIEDAEGREHAVKLTDWNLSLRAGHVLSIVSMVTAKENWKVAVYNHNLQTWWWGNNIDIHICNIAGCLNPGGFFTGLITGVTGYFIARSVRGKETETVFGTSRSWVNGDDFLFVSLVVIASALVGLIIGNTIYNNKGRAYSKEIKQRIIALIKK